MTILVRTPSWADRILVESGKFCPPDVTSPEQQLRYYASQFSMVEGGRLTRDFVAVRRKPRTSLEDSAFDLRQQWLAAAPDPSIRKKTESSIAVSRVARRTVAFQIVCVLGNPVDGSTHMLHPNTASGRSAEHASFK